MPIPLRLIVHQGDQEPREQRFERDIVKIGRLASAHLKLEDTRVSRIHAVIEAGSDGQDYAIIDMGSTEGTLVNGKRISKQRLADGDEIRVGDYRIQVRYGDAAAARDAPAEVMVTGDVLSAQPDPLTSGEHPHPPTVGPHGSGSHPAGVYAPPGAGAASGAYGDHGVPAAYVNSAGGAHGNPPVAGAHGRPGASGAYANPSAYGNPTDSGAYGSPGASGAYANPSAYGNPTDSGAYGNPSVSGAYGNPAVSGAYGHPMAQGPYASPTGSGGYPNPAHPNPGASGGYPIPAPAGLTSPNAHPAGSGVYPSPGDASGVFPSPDTISGLFPNPAASGVYPGPGASVPPVPGAPFHPSQASGHGSGDVAMWPPVGGSPALATTGYPPPSYVSGYHPGWAPPPSVPNNLASASVPDDERALEIKLIWGNSVLETVTATDVPEITLGDERRVAGFGPMQKVIRCDLEVPSHGLPSKTHVLAHRQGREGTTYLLDLPPGLVGRVERADGTVIPVELLYRGEHGADSDGSGGANYLLRAEETIYLGYGHLVLQIRYVRRTHLAVAPLLSRINYTWANTLILAIFFHIVAITSFVATPDLSAQLTDELFRNRNRFIETRLKLAEKKKSSGGILDELKKGPGEKAKKKEGKAGRRDTKKTDGRMASKGKPDDQERARRALDKLLGLGGKGKAAGIFGGNGLGGDLESAMGGLRGRQVGDARGLGGLGTRGTGPGGGGLSMSSVGLGALGTAGRGGGGEGGAGYGSGAASLGGKKDRDVEITAGQAIVRGSLSKEIIRRVIRKHQAQIRYCYEKELQRSPGLYGKVATEFIIDASGLVTSAKVYQTTMNDGEVERCITSKIRTWRFPKPKGGGIVVVKYPFLFKASG